MSAMANAVPPSALKQICGEDFFDFEKTINTTSPDVSQCFQHTVLVFLPCLFFWLFSPCLLCDLHKSGNLPLRWGAFIITKIISSVILSLDAVLLLLWTIYQWKLAPVWFIYPIILSLTTAATVVLLVACKNRGVITSGVLFIFWLLLTVCGLPEFRWWIQRAVENGGLPADPVRFVLYMIWYPLVVAQFLASCFADRPQPYTDLNKDNPCPELRTSFLNQITFQWFTGLAILGNKRPLEATDLWSLNDQDVSKTVVPDFEKRWLPALRRYNIAKQQYATKQQRAVEFNQEEVQIVDGTRQSSKSAASANPPQPPSVLWPLFKTYKGTFLAGLVFKLTFDLMQFISPKLLSLLIDFIEHKERPLWQGIVIASLMFLVALIQSMILHQYFHKMFRLGMNIRSVLTAAVFTKSLRLSNAARKNRTVGEIVNLMSVDIQRFQDMTTFIMLFWSAPLQVTLSIVYLWLILGPAVLAGLGVLIAMVPLNSFLSIKMRKYQVEQMKHKDDRLKMMSEILNGMKVLKLYAWEPSMEKMVLDIRKKELNVLRKLAFLNAATTLSWACAPFMVAVLTFGVFVMIDPENNKLTPQITFVSLALFNILRFPLAIFAMIISQAVQCVVSNKRIKSFLSDEEMDPSLVDRTSSTSRDAIVIENGLFTWDRSAEFQLKDINIALPRDKLIAIVGKVGSGKSSLLAAMLGEMDKLCGYVSTGGTVAYAPQQAWIQNLSLKDNITFGQRFDPVWYNTVVDACALRADFDTLPAGDNTEIGEKGINLSGGQKQRVSLARAVYQRRDIILLDDPLSAVDSHVGKHIFDNVICNEGLLANKTRVLVTHGLHYLKHCDQIIVIRDGSVSETGTYQQLMANAGAFAEFLEEYLIEEAKQRTTSVTAEEDESEIHEVLTELAKYDPNCRQRIQTQISQISQISRDAESASPVGSPPPYDAVDGGPKSPTADGSARQRRIPSLSAEGTDDPAKVPLKAGGTPPKDAQPATATTNEKSKLIEKETTETGKVKWAVYMTYIRAIGYTISLVFVSIYVFSSVLGVFSNLWLANWSDDANRNQTESVWFKVFGMTEKFDISARLIVYTALGLGQALFVCLASVIMALGMVHASRTLHEGILRNILRSAMSFFDVTPLGRILNRVGKDVEVLDGSLPQNIRAFLMTVTSVLMTLIVIIVATPVFGAVIVPLTFVYFMVLDVDVVDFRLPDAIRMFVTMAISTVMTLLIVIFVTPPIGIVIIPASVLYVYALDVDVMDSVLPRSLVQFIQCAIMSLEIMLVVICVTPIFIAGLLPLALIYYLAVRFYVSTSRQLKRLESVTRSPIYSHFQETVQGAPSIRAYNAVDRFIVESEKRVDANLVTYYPSLCANRWLAVRLELVGNLIVLFAALFAVLFRDGNALFDSVTPGLVGLSVSYALNITQTLNWAVRMTSELETNIVAVERIKEYSDTPTEAALEADGDNKPPSEWPEQGTVDFDDYKVRYRPGLDLVLKGITAHIEPQEKIGIIGRTGAGKSSLTLALFRIIEADQGRILIDGRDISKMGLHDLRSKLTIVPQDPVLFSGTLRINLDPFLRYNDDQLWLALENAHLKPYVLSLADKLEHRVAEGGENLSVGQRQLICLARALLRKTKLLILDEAAAAVDMETDALIQKTIRKEFADCTVLTIAHRLNTVLDSDRMLVLDNGKIVEFDTPTKLLADHKTIFYSMAKDAGIVS